MTTHRVYRYAALFAASCLLGFAGGCGGSGSGGVANAAGDPPPGESGPIIESFAPATESTASAGDSVTFTVNTTGGEVILYRWTVDGVRQASLDNELVLATSADVEEDHIVEVAVTDRQLATTGLRWNLRVMKRPKNEPPEITSFSPTGAVTVTQGDAIAFMLTASDPDAGDRLTFEWSVDGRRQTATGPNFSLNTTALTEGSYTVKGVVSDGINHGIEVAHSWALTVRAAAPVNRAPVIGSTAPAGSPKLTAGTSMTFSVTATDPEGDTLAYTWTVDGSGQSATGSTFRYSPLEAQVGAHSVQVKVSDGKANTDGSTDPSFTWSVTVESAAPPPNEAPAITATAPAGSPVLAAGTSITLSVTASDADGDPLSYTWTVDGSAQSATGSTFRYSPTTAQVGTHAVKVKVDDQMTNTTGVDPSFTWSVTVENPAPPPNEAPVISATSPSGSPVVTAGTSITFSVTASDADGDPLSYTWTVDGSAQAATGSTFRYSPTTAQVGNHAVKVKVDDRMTNTTGVDPSFTWSVTVEAPPPPPPPPPPPATYSARVMWDVVTTDTLGRPTTVAGYRLYLAESPSELTTPLGSVTLPEVEIDNLEPGTTYYFAVSAYDAAGNESALSAIVTILQ